MQANKLFVGNLTYSVTKDQLAELFSQYGTVVQVTVLDGKGIAFIEMSTPAEAESAQEILNGTTFVGRALKIDKARPPKTRQSRDFRRY